MLCKYLKEQEGALSEAGLPAVADPGALLVEFAHQHDIEVIPYVGPLAYDGLDGFRNEWSALHFTGYLPVKRQERRARIEQLRKSHTGCSNSDYN